MERRFIGRWNARLVESYPHLSVLRGCCGTDARHVEAIARACITTA